MVVNMIRNVKNISATESSFMIKKVCDKCKNTLYFSESAINNIELDTKGNVIRTSVICPICNNCIVLYTAYSETVEPVVNIKTIRLGDEE